HDQAEQTGVLRLAAAAEYRQQHPVARALRNEARQQGIMLPEIDAGEYRIGYGISVTVEGQEIRVGSERFLQAEQIALPEQLAAVQKAAYSRGHSLVCVASGDTVLGAVELEPVLRPEAKRVVRALQDMNKEVILLSGDHELPTGSIAETVQADQYVAGIAPEDKAGLIEQFREQGRTVCFVGDGINDAIALKKADVSVAVQGASTAAAESAQIVLRERSLEALPEMFDIAKEFQKNIRDTFYAVTYPGVIGIGGVFSAQFTITSAFLMYLFSTLSGMTVSQLPFLRREEKDSTGYAAQSDE
ncbi:MAG: HAD family hydrolase, partial [Candidatus Electrothrix sp. EH2]|nr:HAD family hydrolase [Candidatus Electrothrix sp. EH2]